MSKYRVTLTEVVTYEVMVEADTEDGAKDAAREAHEDGTDTETDNGPVEIESVELVAGLSEAEQKALGSVKAKHELPTGEDWGDDG